MRAFTIGDDGAAIRDIALPTISAHQVLIHCRAAALNRVDLAIRSGRTHGKIGGPGTVMGLECAGVICEIGRQISGFSVGDAVMCSARSAFAEYVACDVGRLHHLPKNHRFEQAACLPVALQTMHDALVTQGQLRAGQSVLIHGASSGVGLMAIRIARIMGAGLVIGTSTNASRRERLTEFGADACLDSRHASYLDEILRLTNNRGVDLLVDQISGPGINECLRATTVGGRLINVGRLAGTQANFDFDLHAQRRIQYLGVTFRTRSENDVSLINRALITDLAKPLSNGLLRLPIDKTFPLEQTNAALDYMQSNTHFGKIVINID